MLNSDARGNGTGAGRGPEHTTTAAHEPAPCAPDELAAARWLQRYEAAWLGRQWTELEGYLAADVAVLSPGMSACVVGRQAVLDHMRSMMCNVQVHEYNTTELAGRFSGDFGIVSYQWQLDWTVQSRREQLSGHDLLLLQATTTGWQLLRRRPLQR